MMKVTATYAVTVGGSDPRVFHEAEAVHVDGRLAVLVKELYGKCEPAVLTRKLREAELDALMPVDG